MINNKDQIIKYFEDGIKEEGNLKIGVEHEKFIFNKKDNTYLFWYVSEEKLEPRLGERYNEPGASLEQPLGIGKMVNDLYKTIETFLWLKPWLKNYFLTTALHQINSIIIIFSSAILFLLTPSFMV